MMRKRFLAAVAAISSMILTAADVDVQLSADAVAAGEIVELRLTSSVGVPQLTEYPTLEGGRWLRNRTNQSQSTQIINGQRSSRYTVSYAILAEKEGTLTIPSLKVMMDGRTENTTPLSVRVLAADERALAANQEGGGTIPLREALFGRIRIPDKRTTYYLGEEVPAELQLFFRQGVPLRGLSNPEPTMPHVVLSAENGGWPENEPPRQTIVDGKRFYVVSRPFRFRSLAAGVVRPSASGVAVVAEQRRSMMDDDPFGAFFSIMDRGATRQYPVAYECDREITFRALPPPPDGSVSLGLVGRWQVDFSLDAPEKIKAGEVVSLYARITGQGTLEMLTAPKLEIPGFRVYPPEVKPLRGGGRAIVWTMIPLRSGTVELKTELAYFNTESGKYDVASFARPLTVLPSDRPLDSVVSAQQDTEETAATAPAMPELPQQSGLLYVKRLDEGGSGRILSGSFWGWLLLLLIGGPVFWGVTEGIGRHRRRVCGDEQHRRRSSARRMRRVVLKQLGKARTPAELSETVHSAVVPMLNDYFGFPPGLTAMELADRVEDAELAEVLRSLSDGAYAPGAETSGELCRERLQKVLKRIMIWLLLLWGGWVCVPVSASDALAADPAQAFRRGMEAYDAGDFEQAAKEYRSAWDPEHPNPALLYNLGCVAFMQQDYPLATLFFESSRRLDPTDSAALENLNLSRRKLGLPEVGRVTSPTELLTFARDQFRPEWWLLLGAGAWFGVFVVLAFRRTLGVNASRITAGVLFGVMLLCTVAFISQWHGPYHKSRAVVMRGGAPLHSLPTASGRLEGTVPAGHEVQVLEERKDYTLIRYGKQEGWTPATAVRRILLH